MCYVYSRGKRTRIVFITICNPAFGLAVLLRHNSVLNIQERLYVPLTADSSISAWNLPYSPTPGTTITIEPGKSFQYCLQGRSQLNDFCCTRAVMKSPLRDTPELLFEWISDVTSYVSGRNTYGVYGLRSKGYGIKKQEESFIHGPRSS